MKDTGGFAFPSDESERYVREYGMTLRDWFAGQALAGLLAAHNTLVPNGSKIGAEWAYKFADAMLQVREASHE